jgi:hypothetical protein
MFRRIGALFGTLTCFCAPAVAQDVSTGQWAHENSFCQAVAQIAPIDDGSGYGVALLAPSGTTISAHVTLVTDTDAYDANVQNATLTGSPNNRESEPILVKTPVATKVKYFFVDSFAIAGGQRQTCPSYVFEVRDGIADSPSGALIVGATHLQTLATIRCGHAYEPPHINGDVHDIVGTYGSRPLSNVAHVYIDSKGQPIEVKLTKSSGVEGLDQFTLGAIEEHRFTPARFLCTPVVGQMTLQMNYMP